MLHSTLMLLANAKATRFFYVFEDLSSKWTDCKSSQTYHLHPLETPWWIMSYLKLFFVWGAPWIFRARKGWQQAMNKTLFMVLLDQSIRVAQLSQSSYCTCFGEVEQTKWMVRFITYRPRPGVHCWENTIKTYRELPTANSQHGTPHQHRNTPPQLGHFNVLHA